MRPGVLQHTEDTQNAAVIPVGEVSGPGIRVHVATNPYFTAWRRMERHRRAVEPLSTQVLRVVLALVATAAVVPLARPVFFRFLDAEPAQFGEGLEAIVQRLGLLLIGWLALDVYTALVRGPDRAVLDLHPVDGGAVALFEVLRVGWKRLFLIGAGAAVLAPVALAGRPGAWAVAVVSLIGAYTLGLFAAGFVHLLAIEVSEDPGWAPILDLVRGHNPRAQAAFLYAPGVVLAGAGAVVFASARGVRWLVDGDLRGLGLLLVPFALAPWLARTVPGLGRKSWLRASSVLAEIDARYAALERPEDARRVYLDWAVRFLPANVARYALKDLRNGWRARRGFITGAWLGGAAAGLMGWSGAAGAPQNALVAVTGVAFAAAAIGVLLDRDEPEFLVAWLPARGAAAQVARALVVLAWLQGAIWPAVFTAGIRHGSGAAALIAGGGLAATLLATGLALACARWRTGGFMVYVPSAAVASAALAAWVSGVTP